MDIETAREEDAENSGECDEAIVEKGTLGPDLTLLRLNFNPASPESFSLSNFCFLLNKVVRTLVLHRVLT